MALDLLSDVRLALLTVPLTLIAAHLSFLAVGSYRHLWSFTSAHDLLMVGIGSTLAVVSFWSLMFLLGRLEVLRPAEPLIQWMLLTVLLLGSRLSYSVLAARRRERRMRRTQAEEPVLLVGGGKGANLAIELLGSMHGKPWRPVGILARNHTAGRWLRHVPILGHPAELQRVLGLLTIQGQRPHRIIMTAPRDVLGVELVAHLRAEASAAHVAVHDLAELMELRESQGQRKLDTGARRPVLAMRDALDRGGYAGMKRLADILISLAVLIAAAPLLALVALLIALNVGVPILFYQMRPGYLGRIFKLLKFRTMREAFDANGRILDDKLRTPLVGRILRRTRLDELPQFWNVLVGDMTIIGPRPLLERDLYLLDDLGQERCRVKPGITGWAQVHGGHQLAPDEKLALDLWYVRNASLTVDLTIAWRTIQMMIFGEKVDTSAIDRAKAAIQPA